MSENPKPPTASTRLTHEQRAEARARFSAALAARKDTLGFDELPHQAVFGRDLGGWRWLGWTEGACEHIHLYQLPNDGSVAMLLIGTDYCVSTRPDSDYGVLEPRTFDAAFPNGRRRILTFLTEYPALRFAPSPDRMVTKIHKSRGRTISTYNKARCDQRLAAIAAMLPGTDVVPRRALVVTPGHDDQPAVGKITPAAVAEHLSQHPGRYVTVVVPAGWDVPATDPVTSLTALELEPSDYRTGDYASKRPCSAFRGHTDTGTPLDDQLRALGVTEVDLAGGETDCCVEATAVSAVNCDYSVALVPGLHAGRSAAHIETALRQLAVYGVPGTGYPVCP